MNDVATRSFRESQISNPELFFGIVSTVGADVASTIQALNEALDAKGYDTFHVKISGLFPSLSKSLEYQGLTSIQTRIGKIESYIRFGNFMRERFGGDILCALAMGEVINERAIALQ